MGVLYFQEGKLADAAAMFNKAAKMAPNAAEVQMNLGLIDMANSEMQKAEAAFGRASGVPELPAALGTLYTERGEYDKAVAAFGNTASNNAAVAQICAGDYNKAQNTLSAIQNKDAMTYYLMAVVGARTNNQNMVSTNLKQAVTLDPTLKTFALSDLEFAKYNVASMI